MQQIRPIAVAMIVFILAALCKKENVTSPVPQPVTQKKIIEEKNFTCADLRKYSYDAQGRVLTVESATHSWRFVVCN